MQYQKVFAPVSVNLSISNAGIPIINEFVWEHRDYQVRKMNLISRMYKGQFLVYIFSVSTKEGAYKLSFDTETLRWQLDEVYWQD